MTFEERRTRKKKEQKPFYWNSDLICECIDNGNYEMAIAMSLYNIQEQLRKGSILAYPKS